MKITVLGSGTSFGVPMPSCECDVCRSSDSRDTRTRASILVTARDEKTEHNIVVDTGPEFRVQALREKINHVDAVLYTHTHADHIHGIDDLRIYSRAKGVPVYAMDDVLETIKFRFSYIFEPYKEGGGLPHLELHSLGREYDAARVTSVTCGSLTVTPIPVKHGSADITGFLFEDAHLARQRETRRAAYITDVSHIPFSSLQQLHGLDVLIITGLRARPHGTHFSFAQSLDIAALVKPRAVYMTHICHEHSHCDIQHILDEYMKEHHINDIYAAPAFDGMVV